MTLEKINLGNMKKTLDMMNEGEISPVVLNQTVEQLAGKEMENTISEIKQQVNETNTLSIQAKTKIESHKTSYGKILNELRALGIEPKNMNNELFELCKEIVDTALEINKTMPDIKSIKLMLEDKPEDVITF